MILKKKTDRVIARAADTAKCAFSSGECKGDRARPVLSTQEQPRRKTAKTTLLRASEVPPPDAEGLENFATRIAFRAKRRKPTNLMQWSWFRREKAAPLNEKVLTFALTFP
jgi:hypothetical protein